MPLAPGLEITASIRLVRKLGEGGMGSIWVAEHLGLRTQVAVKFMSEHLAQDGGAAARFSREAAAAAQIKSPHVVQVFDHGLFEGHVPYIVMELLEGENLSSFIQCHGGLLSARATADIVAQMCRALGKAHASGVIHRDIKPDNVFVIDSDGEPFVKVLDFGIAKQSQGTQNVTSTGALLGTPYYMSPEQMLSAKHVDPRSDLWAVGVVAYQCVTGKVPFNGETFAGVAVAISQGHFSLPHAESGLGSPELDAWFERALAKNPNERFASARELAEALVAAAAAGSSLSLTGDRAVVQTASLATAPKTFPGVAATLTGGSKRPRRGARSAFLVITAIAALAGLAVLFFRSAYDKPEISATEPTEPSSGAPPHEPTRIASVPIIASSASATPLLPKNADPMVVEPTTEPSKKTGAPPASPAPNPPARRRAATRPRAQPASPQPTSAAPAPGITDRGF
jgi:serine/threonine-protein kinase